MAEDLTTFAEFIKLLEEISFVNSPAYIKRSKIKIWWDELCYYIKWRIIERVKYKMRRILK